MKIKLFTIPNLLTLSNLMCGSLAVVSTLVYSNLTWAFWFIVAAAVFDFFDGFAARLLKCPSEIGVQLDSLADMVSFGFAPAAMFFTMYGSATQMWDWNETVVTAGRFAMFVMTAFSALRLAKFNIDDTQHTEFVGLTTTANAIFCSSIGWLFATGTLPLSREAMILVVAVMSWLMIANVRMFSLKFSGFGWKGNALRYGFMIFAAVALIAAGIWKSPIYAIPAIIVIYVLISLTLPLFCKAGRCETKK